MIAATAPFVIALIIIALTLLIAALTFSEGWRYGEWGMMIGATVVGLVIIVLAADLGLYSQEEFEVDYEDKVEEFEMGNCDWKQHFRDAAYKSELKFWYGGDQERGELAIFYQTECDRDPTGTDTLHAPIGKHQYIEPYRTTGEGGWDGEYPKLTKALRDQYYNFYN